MNSPDLFYQNYSVLGGTVFGEAYNYYDDDKVFAAASSIKLLLETLPFISRKVDID